MIKYPTLHRIRRLRDSLPICANKSSDLASKTGDRRCVHVEGNLHQQPEDSAPTQRKQQINIRRGVRQGDTISSKLFTAALESIFRQLTWETRGLKIDGEYLSHVRFIDVDSHALIHQMNYNKGCRN